MPYTTAKSNMLL